MRTDDTVRLTFCVEYRSRDIDEAKRLAVRSFRQVALQQQSRVQITSKGSCQAAFEPGPLRYAPSFEEVISCSRDPAVAVCESDPGVGREGLAHGVQPDASGVGRLSRCPGSGGKDNYVAPASVHASVEQVADLTRESGCFRPDLRSQARTRERERGPGSAHSDREGYGGKQ